MVRYFPSAYLCDPTYSREQKETTLPSVYGVGVGGIEGGGEGGGFGGWMNVIGYNVLFFSYTVVNLRISLAVMFDW